MFRILLIAAAIVATIFIAFDDSTRAGAADAQLVLTLLALSALPLVAFAATPGRLWTKLVVFVVAFAASTAAVASLLRPKEAMQVIDLWLWMLAIVGGGLLYWWLQDEEKH